MASFLVLKGHISRRPQIPMNLMSSDEKLTNLVTSKISLLFIQSLHLKSILKFHGKIP